MDSHNYIYNVSRHCKWFVLFFLIVNPIIVQLAPVVKRNSDNFDSNLTKFFTVQRYLNRYGYAQSLPLSERLSESSLASELEEFQRQMGLEPTGKMDPETMKLIEKTRCGNKDRYLEYNITKSSKRNKRYALHLEHLQKSDINYKIVSFPQNDDGSQQSAIIKIFQRAFKAWSREIPVKFHMVVGDIASVDLEIAFVRNHNCLLGELSGTVEGKKNLGHAHFPGHQPRQAIHINDHIEWSYNSSQDASKEQTSLLSTAIHEIGHVIGMHHSNEKNAVMWATGDNIEQLQKDDIEGASILYSLDPVKAKFHVLEGRTIVGAVDYKKNAPDLKYCLDYLESASLNLAVFDSKLRKCIIMVTDELPPGESTLTKDGIVLGRKSIPGFLYKMSQSADDFNLWVDNGECDTINRRQTKSDSDTIYNCKRYNEQAGSYIIIRKD